MRGVGHLVVHDGVDEHRHRVFGEDLYVYWYEAFQVMVQFPVVFILPLVVVFQKFDSSYQSSRRYQHKE